MAFVPDPPQAVPKRRQSSAPYYVPGPSARPTANHNNGLSVSSPFNNNFNNNNNNNSVPYYPSPPSSLSSSLGSGLSRKLVVSRRLSESESGRLKEELKCERCGKGYKHISCLTKHLWEHTPEWSMTSKLPLSKHQQVQLLEAASILVSMNEFTIGPDVRGTSPTRDESSSRASLSMFDVGFSSVPTNSGSKKLNSFAASTLHYHHHHNHNHNHHAMSASRHLRRPRSIGNLGQNIVSYSTANLSSTRTTTPSSTTAPSVKAEGALVTPTSDNDVAVEEEDEEEDDMASSSNNLNSSSSNNNSHDDDDDDDDDVGVFGKMDD